MFTCCRLATVAENCCSRLYAEADLILPCRSKPDLSRTILTFSSSNSFLLNSASASLASNFIEGLLIVYKIKVYTLNVEIFQVLSTNKYLVKLHFVNFQGAQIQIFLYQSIRDSMRAIIMTILVSTFIKCNKKNDSLHSIHNFQNRQLIN